MNTPTPASAYTIQYGELFRASVLTRGPWHPEHQHAGPPSARVCRAIERAAAEAGLTHLGRLTGNLLRPVPVGECRVEVAVDYVGRNAGHYSARLLGGGKEVARFTALMQRKEDLPVPPGTAGHPVRYSSGGIMSTHVLNHSIEVRAGAFLVIAGSILNLGSNDIQPQISDYANTMEVFEALVATRAWEFSRIGVLIASLFGLCGLFLVRRAFQGHRGESWFLLAIGSAFVTTPVIAVMMGMDLAQKQMATLIAISGPDQPALALWAGHGLHSAYFAIFSISLVLASVTPLLVGSVRAGHRDD